ncbi:MAG: IS5 family transposase [Maricaulaceae bacterium]
MSQRRYELTDFEWSIIAPLLPNKPRGVPRANDRRVLNGIFWRLRTGSPWADIPERYGPATTCYNRFVRWRKRGVWDRIFDAVSKAYKGDTQSVDASSIRVHQHGANGKAGKKTASAAGLADLRARCMGRSRGGLTTKIHALVDADGLPVRLKLTPGQDHDGVSAHDMLDGIKAGRVLLADAAYDLDRLRAAIAEQGGWACVKPIRTRKTRPVFSPFLYKGRNVVERFFNKLKHFRAIATRYEKHDDNFLALVKLASARIWMRFMSHWVICDCFPRPA